MSDGFRSSIEQRYEREGGLEVIEHEAHPSEHATPVLSPGAISISVPGSPPQVTYSQAPTGLTTGLNVAPGVSVMPGSSAPTIITQPAPMFMSQPGAPQITIVNPPQAGSPCPVCGKPLGDKASNKDGHGDHGHKGPAPAPRFSRATPEVFRDGFKPLWDSAQSEKAAFVVVSGCTRLLDVLLKDLEAKAGPGDLVRKKGGWSFFGPPEPKKVTVAERLEALQKKGMLLKSTVEAAKYSVLTDVLNDKVDATAVTSDMARRYVHLLWQVADQGFEQPEWCRSGEPPKPLPQLKHSEDHGHHGHGHHEAHHPAQPALPPAGGPAAAH